MVKLERELDPWHSVTSKAPLSDIQTSRRDVHSMKIKKTEAQGTFSIFAWPELIPWEQKIAPLLSPCGRKGWEVGDFWAIDEEGQVLIVENKLRQNRKSPFKEFEHHNPPTADALRNHWLIRLDQEMIFRRTYPDGPPAEMPEQSWPGVLDSSRGRMECRRYRHVYMSELARNFDNGEYRRAAEEYLNRYEAKTMLPHYFGLYTLFGADKVPALVNDHGLVKSVGKDNVHAFAVQKSPDDCYFPDDCEIRSYRVQVREA